MQAPTWIHDDRGSADLPSTMVSVTVSAVLLGIISFVAFVAVPWQQNTSAKAMLSTVGAAESSVSSANGLYLDLEGLERRGALAKPLPEHKITVNALAGPYTPSQGQSVAGLTHGKHYVAFIESPTGEVYFLSDSHETPQELEL